MTISVLQYTREITSTIRDAKRQGVISQFEAKYLHSMVEDSSSAASTMALVAGKGMPDFLYAALYFSTLVWTSGETTHRDADAQAGYKLAQFVLRKESPAHDPCWAAKLLRELYDAHEESMQCTRINRNRRILPRV
jgi:hypothetical protein